MQQSKLESLIEVLFNVFIGFSINWIANLLILPVYGFAISANQAFSMGLLFTAISVVRGYVIRRWFNNKLKESASKVAGFYTKE